MEIAHAVAADLAILTDALEAPGADLDNLLRQLLKLIAHACREPVPYALELETNRAEPEPSDPAPDPDCEDS